LFGASNGSDITFSSSTGSAIYVAGSGSETLDASGSSTGNLLIGTADTAAGASLIKAGTGNDTLEGTGGNATLTGGSGDNLFLFNKGLVFGGAPHDIVTDFTASATNLVLLANYGASEAAGALAGATTVGGNTTITLSDNTKITFNNTSTAQLQGHVFSF
jgi:Ca2+-binding RTX toxin-like protein